MMRYDGLELSCILPNNDLPVFEGHPDTAEHLLPTVFPSILVEVVGRGEHHIAIIDPLEPRR